MLFEGHRWKRRRGLALLDHSEGIYGTFDWTRRCVAARAGCSTWPAAWGGFGATTSGIMWCDDVSLIALESAFPAAP